jgi:hypothetical protein
VAACRSNPKRRRERRSSCSTSLPAQETSPRSAASADARVGPTPRSRQAEAVGQPSQALGPNDPPPVEERPSRARYQPMRRAADAGRRWGHWLVALTLACDLARASRVGRDTLANRPMGTVVAAKAGCGRDPRQSLR